MCAWKESPLTQQSQSSKSGAMEPDAPTHVLLTIRQHAKGVPYAGGTRPNGTTNHGFKLLKGTGVPPATIFEAADEPALLRLLGVLNASGSAFLSLGCEKSLNQRDGKHWKR